MLTFMVVEEMSFAKDLEEAKINLCFPAASFPVVGQEMESLGRTARKWQGKQPAGWTFSKLKWCKAFASCEVTFKRPAFKEDAAKDCVLPEITSPTE